VDGASSNGALLWASRGLRLEAFESWCCVLRRLKLRKIHILRILRATMPTITATDLARNTRAILDQVAGGEAVDVERNQRIIATLVPAVRSMTAQEALAGLRPMLSRTWAGQWLKDSRTGFDDGVRNPWG